MSVIIDTARGSRLGTALFVIISPVIILAATITALFVTLRDILVEELPEFFREDIAPAFRFAFVEPVLAAYVAAQVALASYRKRVGSAFWGFRSNLTWAVDEASFFVKEGTVKPSGTWLWTAIKDTGSSAWSLLKTLAGR